MIPLVPQEGGQRTFRFILGRVSSDEEWSMGELEEEEEEDNDDEERSPSSGVSSDHSDLD